MQPLVWTQLCWNNWEGSGLYCFNYTGLVKAIQYVYVNNPGAVFLFLVSTKLIIIIPLIMPIHYHTLCVVFHSHGFKALNDLRPSSPRDALALCMVSLQLLSAEALELEPHPLFKRA